MIPRCYHQSVRQLITRIDDDVHRRLKARARAEGSSVNTLVTAAIERALATPEDRRRAMRRRLQSLGLLADAPAPPVAPDREAVIESLRGCGKITDLIEAERNER